MQRVQRLHQTVRLAEWNKKEEALLVKKFLSVLLILSLIFQCVGVVAEEELSGKDLLEFVEDEVYGQLVDTMDPETFFVEEVSAIYISQEYLEELEYNSQANIFFGYSLDDINEVFQGDRYVFTLSEQGTTTVEKFVEYKDDTFDKVIKNVLIGGGIIIVSVVVTVLTKSPAAGQKASKTVRMIYTISREAVRKSTSAAVNLAIMNGATAAITEAYETGNLENVAKSALLGASEGFAMGAMFGTVEGITSGIFIKGDRYYFEPGTPQSKKYPDGVKITTAADGKQYLRFEEYSIATAKFDKPTMQTALDHTGLSGQYVYDAKLANAQLGFKNTPKGYVWHHNEDMQTMILIPQDIHSFMFGGMRHSGGASLIRKYLEVAQ